MDTSPSTAERPMTQDERIMAFLMENPNSYYLVSDFQRSGSPAPFIGYKAGTILSALATKGLINSRWSEHKTQGGRNLKEYAYVVEEEVRAPVVSEQPIPQQGAINFGSLDF